MEDPQHHPIESSHLEQGRAGDEAKLGDLPELRMVEGSPQTTKRKRQFANRTKTGCITCRRRKKKCDEGKPECTNCKRGGFVCEGYTNKISWPKAPVKSTQPPISIKPMDINQSASTSPSPGAAPLILSTQGHLLLEGDQQSASNLSPQQRPANIEKSYAAATPPPGGQPQPAQKTTVPQHQPQEYGLPRTPTFVTSGPLIPSPRATTPGPSVVYGGGEMTDKQKMLSGQWYYGSSPELMAERERCKQACYRFNNALMMNASKAEQWRLFVETLRPGGQYEGMPGGVVNKVDVETPFHCNYGTNISLGEEVRIGPGCTIIDAAPVTIKARTILDGDVKIYTTIRKQDPRSRMGAKGPEWAKPVVIEEDCWIGGNVTILQGVTIGRGSVVRPGSVVCRDVPQFTVADGHPATIMSGIIYNNGAGM
ncbi:trimeric LpxA-like protein [Terfezia boudieri ATCC MYA-4762]|uniref:Trimeric LpxA-like protein n=1 Tax=Terfezia boudieri ATCC MYA-4762 TaxID=1051890 RepID=A0A3N4M3B8_9PEZI|nr:trimeric LpxA-like protein [Terfezia boudieri ATCC MYA-4762]